jgi:hypothetical protein
MLTMRESIHFAGDPVTADGTRDPPGRRWRREIRPPPRDLLK